MPALSLNFYVLYAVAQNDVYKLIAGIVGFRCQPIKLCQGVLFDTDGDDLIAILASPFDLQGFICH